MVGCFGDLALSFTGLLFINSTGVTTHDRVNGEQLRGLWGLTLMLLGWHGGAAFALGCHRSWSTSGARSGFSSYGGLLRQSGSARRSFFRFVGQHLANLTREIGNGEGLLDERHTRCQHVREKLATISAHVEYSRLGAK